MNWVWPMRTACVATRTKTASRARAQSSVGEVSHSRHKTSCLQPVPLGCLCLPALPACLQNASRVCSLARRSPTGWHYCSTMKLASSTWAAFTGNLSARMIRMPRAARNAMARMECWVDRTRSRRLLRHQRSRALRALSPGGPEGCGALYGRQTQIISNYTESIHGKLLKTGLTVTATCTSCHTAHSVLPRTDPASSINAANVPE